MAFKMKGSPYPKHKPGHTVTKEVKLKKRSMHPGDATFEGSETSDVNQPLNSYGTGGATHYPEGTDSKNIDTVGKKRKTTTVTTDTKGNTTKKVKRKSGRTKTFTTDAKGNTVKKVDKADGSRAKGKKGHGKTVKTTKRRTGHSKKDQEDLDNTSTTYIK